MEKYLENMNVEKEVEEIKKVSDFLNQEQKKIKKDLEQRRILEEQRRAEEQRRRIQAQKTPYSSSKTRSGTKTP